MCLDNAGDAVGVDKLHPAELRARSAGLEQTAGEQPGTDNACRRCATDRRLVVGKDAALLVNPPAQVSEPVRTTMCVSR